MTDIANDRELSEIDKEAISDMIRDGFTEGELHYPKGWWQLKATTTEEGGDSDD